MTTSRPVLILANGEPPPTDLLRGWAARIGLLFCTDGAVATALAAGLTPDVVVGDMDSLPPDAAVPGERLRLAEQDTTDLEKALLVALDRGCTGAVILGAGGRRWDHFVGNLSLLARYADRLRIEAGDAHGWLTVLRPHARHTLDLPPGATVSFLPLPSAGGVTLSGVRWPLADATLGLDGRVSISNEATGAVTVRYEAGCLAVYVVS